MMRGSWSGWWLIGGAFMVFCMVMMARMMMMGHGHSGHETHRTTDEAERTLADRLARGEIAVEEYDRLLGVLRQRDRSTQT